MNRSEHKAMAVLMANCCPMYGLEIIEQSNGVLSKGTVYVTLARLEERGWIKSEPVFAGGGGLIPRRLYEITTEGARAYWKTPVSAPKRWWQFWR